MFFIIVFIKLLLDIVVIVIGIFCKFCGDFCIFIIICLSWFLLFCVVWIDGDKVVNVYNIVNVCGRRGVLLFKFSVIILIIKVF